MANLKHQVCCLVTFNVIIMSLVCLTFSLNYMSFSSSVSLSFWTATYTFEHDGDPSTLRTTYGNYKSVLCEHTADKALQNLTEFCGLVDKYEIAGLSCVVFGGVALLCLAYIVGYLFALMGESRCAGCFKAYYGQLLLFLSYCFNLIIPAIETDFFPQYSAGKVDWELGLPVMFLVFFLILLSSGYLFYLSRKAIPLLERTFLPQREMLRPLAQPLLPKEEPHSA